MVHHTK
jgi:hypothetical protein